MTVTAMTVILAMVGIVTISTSAKQLITVVINLALVIIHQVWPKYNFWNMKYYLIGSYICDCGPGYEGDGFSGMCSNINECDRNMHNCEHLCTDTIGSFECSCEVRDS